MKNRMSLKSLMTLSFSLISISLSAQQLPIFGYSPDGAEQQRKLEKEFDSKISSQNLDDWMKQLTAHPHEVGSPYGKENAEFMLSLFKSWGYNAKIETYYVLFPTPKTRILEMTGPTTFKASLVEPALEEDGTSNQQAEQLPTYNAYSIDGDVTGQLVYVNQGIPRDYEELARRGIDVKGKIVIARYGGSWRGIKPKVAAENGAIGCILYSDPVDDGYYQGDVYPKGAFKSEYGVQRGSVQDMPFYPGDPSTPNVGSTKKVKRLEVNEIQTLTKIPVLPISYNDAQPLLEALEGPVAPKSWRGALPITYHLGPGETSVHLKLEFNWNIVEAYNVIARMEGNEFPDQWIMRGNHHDGWVNGAADPISGMVALLEEARVVGELAKTGWKPKRTILYAAWDAEEPGLIGSTEWAEHHEQEIKEKMVAYINTDGSSRGFLFGGGSHTLEKYYNEVAREVIDPQKEITVSERKRAYLLVNGSPEVKKEVAVRKDIRLSPLGSGSDYSPFLQHLGIASLNLGFGGEGSGGQYHSIYDSYDHFIRFKDPGFVYGASLSKVAGRLTLRLANADILPFDFSGFVDNVSKYAQEVQKLADDMREKTEVENKLITNGTYDHVLDPKKAVKAPVKKDPVPFINFAPLQNAVASLNSAIEYYKEVWAESGEGANLTPEQKKQLNELLLQLERHLTNENGLPRRDWYKHTIYAPGFYTGYGVKTLPGIREAIEQRYWAEVDEQMDVISGTLSGFTEQVKIATAIIK